MMRAPRCGLANRQRLTCVTSPGQIDGGYSDKLRVLLLNTDPTEDYDIRNGDRVDQQTVQCVVVQLRKKFADQDTILRCRSLGATNYSA